MSLELGDGGVQPDRLAEVKGIAYLIQRAENFVSAGVLSVIADTVSSPSAPFKLFCHKRNMCPSFLRYLSNHYSTGAGQKEEAAASGCLRKKEIREKR